MTKGAKLLLISNTYSHDGYLEHAKDEIKEFLRGIGSLLFVPFALADRDQYTKVAKDYFKKLGINLNSIHQSQNPKKAVSEAKAIYVVGGNPSAIMLEDRGPQITFEVINGYDLTPEQANKLEISIPETHGNYDLRVPILERAEQLFVDANLQVSSRLGGVFAIDFAIKGVSKTTAIKYVLSDDSALSSLGLNRADLRNAKQIEVWGDKFSTIRGGTDRHMSEALPKDVRSIDFREENPDEFEKGYNIVVWSGKYHLHHSLLEYLKSR